MKAKISMIIALFLMFHIGNVYAQTSLNVTKLGSWLSGTYSTVIFVQGNYAYHGSYDIFTIFDISTLSAGNITGIGQYVAPNRIERICVSGSYAYLLIQNTGLQIVDISDPYHPAGSGFLMLSGTPNSMSVVGNYAYITSNNGLTVVDANNPSNPVVSGTYIPSGSAQLKDVKVQGNVAFVVSSINGLRILNIQNPATITEIGSFVPGSFTYYSVALNGNSAFLAYGSSQSQNGNISVIDITTPVNPVLLNTFIVSSFVASNLHISGNSLYASNNNNKISIINISNPSQPVNIGNIDTEYHNINYKQFAVTQNNNFILYPKEYGFCVFDVSNPLNSFVVTYYCDDSQINEILKHGNLIYTCERLSTTYGDFYGFIRVFDVTNPNVPLYLHSHPITEWSHLSKNRIFIQGQCLFVTNLQEYTNQPNGFLIYDISNPFEFIELGEFKILNATSVGIYVQGNYAYVCFEENGLYIVDISNPSAPLQVGHVILSGSAIARFINVSGNYAYITDSFNLLHVIDVSVPTMPTQIATHILAPPPAGIQYTRGNHFSISGSLIYTAIPSPSCVGIIITDVSNPANPQNIGSYSGISSPTSVSMAGNIIYSSDYSSGLQVLDISNLAQVSLGGYFYINGANSNSLIGDGDYIYLTTNKKGIYILRNDYQTSIENNIKDNAPLIIYPNPFSESAFIQLPTDFKNSEKIKVRVVDTQGKEMNVLLNNDIQTDKGLMLHKNSLNSGTYIIEVSDENGKTATGRVIIL